MYRVKKKKREGVSRPCMILVKVPFSYHITTFLGLQERKIDHEYEFQMIDQGEIIEKFHAKDVYHLHPTHDTYEEFIIHWLADQDMQSKSSLDLTCIFSQKRSQGARLSSTDFEKDSDNNE